MAAFAQYEADRINGANGGGAFKGQSPINTSTSSYRESHARARAVCHPRGALVFVNSRSADYLGLPSDHPLRFGIDVGGESAMLKGGTGGS